MAFQLKTVNLKTKNKKKDLQKKVKFRIKKYPTLIVPIDIYLNYCISKLSLNTVLLI